MKKATTKTETIEAIETVVPATDVEEMTNTESVEEKTETPEAEIEEMTEAVAKETRGRKFSIKNLKPYERKAFNFIRSQYPQYDVATKFEEEIRILDSALETKGKLGMFQTKFNLITMFPARIEVQAAKQYFMYSRASSHLMPPEGMTVEVELYMTLVFLHEMTHAMQMFEGTDMNEVDTTRNEIEYLRLNHADIYIQLIPSQTKPLYRTKQFLTFDNGAIRKVKNTVWFPTKTQWRYYLLDEEGNVQPRYESDMIGKVVHIFTPKKAKKDKTVSDTK